MLVRDQTAQVPSGPLRVAAVKVVFVLSGWGRLHTPTGEELLGAGSILTIPNGIECRGFPAEPDYFLPYKNGDRKTSLDSRGYPQYKAVAKTASLLSELFPKASDHSRVVAQLAGNHQHAMASLREVGFFCFRYAMEIDLVAAQETRRRLFVRLNVPRADQTLIRSAEETGAVHLSSSRVRLHSLTVQSSRWTTRVATARTEPKPSIYPPFSDRRTKALKARCKALLGKRTTQHPPGTP